MSNKVPVSLKYIDEDVYIKLKNIAASKGKQIKKKTDLFEWIMKDYIDMHELDKFHNPYLLNHISNTMDSVTNNLERRLGGRLFSIVSELAINSNVMTQIVYKFMNQYMDPHEAQQDYQKFRQEAVDDLRHHDLSPMTYVDVIMKDCDDNWHG